MVRAKTASPLDSLWQYVLDEDSDEETWEDYDEGPRHTLQRRRRQSESDRSTGTAKSKNKSKNSGRRSDQQSLTRSSHSRESTPSKKRVRFLLPKREEPEDDPVPKLPARQASFLSLIGLGEQQDSHEDDDDDDDDEDEDDDRREEDTSRRKTNRPPPRILARMFKEKEEGRDDETSTISWSLMNNGGEQESGMPSRSPRSSRLPWIRNKKGQSDFDYEDDDDNDDAVDDDSREQPTSMFDVFNTNLFTAAPAATSATKDLNPVSDEQRDDADDRSATRGLSGSANKPVETNKKDVLNDSNATYNTSNKRRGFLLGMRGRRNSETSLKSKDTSTKSKDTSTKSNTNSETRGNNRNANGTTRGIGEKKAVNKQVDAGSIDKTEDATKTHKRSGSNGSWADTFGLSQAGRDDVSDPPTPTRGDKSKTTRTPPPTAAKKTSNSDAATSIQRWRTQQEKNGNRGVSNGQEAVERLAERSSAYKQSSPLNANSDASATQASQISFDVPSESTTDQDPTFLSINNSLSSLFNLPELASHSSVSASASVSDGSIGLNSFSTKGSSTVQSGDDRYCRRFLRDENQSVDSTFFDPGTDPQLSPPVPPAELMVPKQERNKRGRDRFTPSLPSRLLSSSSRSSGRSKLGPKKAFARSSSLPAKFDLSNSGTESSNTHDGDDSSYHRTSNYHGGSRKMNRIICHPRRNNVFTMCRRQKDHDLELPGVRMVGDDESTSKMVTAVGSGEFITHDHIPDEAWAAKSGPQTLYTYEYDEGSHMHVSYDHFSTFPRDVIHLSDFGGAPVQRRGPDDVVVMVEVSSGSTSETARDLLDSMGVWRALVRICFVCVAVSVAQRSF